MLNPELTKEDAIWLIEEYGPRQNGRINGDTMDTYFVPARSLMQGKKSDRPGCACQFKSYVMMCKSMYGQYHDEIKAIAYPVVKTKAKRGRKKTV